MFYINDRKINVTVNKLNLLFIKLSFVSWFYSRGDTKGEICINKKKKLMLAFCISWGSSLMQYASQYITCEQNKGVYKILDIPCSTKTVNLILISSSGAFIRNYFCACSSNIKTYLVPFALFHTYDAWMLTKYLTNIFLCCKRRKDFCLLTEICDARSYTTWFDNPGLTNLW